MSLSTSDGGKELPDTASPPQLQPPSESASMPRRALVVLRTPMTFFRTVFRVAQVGKKQRQGYDLLAICICNYCTQQYNRLVTWACLSRRLRRMGSVFSGIFASVIWKDSGEYVISASDVDAPASGTCFALVRCRIMSYL